MYKIYIIRPKPDWKHSGRLETFKQILAWISSQSTQLRGLTSTIRFDHIENFQSSSSKHNKENQHGRFDLNTQSASCKQGFNLNELGTGFWKKRRYGWLVYCRMKLKGNRKQNKGIFLFFQGPRINEKCGQICSNWQHCMISPVRSAIHN